MREEVSFCRICPAHCGVRMTIDDNDRIVRIVGDRENPLSKGYACFKGLQAEEAHHGSARLLHPLKRTAEGAFQRIGFEDALDEIAERMRILIDRHGPQAIAGFSGNGAVYNHVTFALFPQWIRALGSDGYFSTMTIDQPAKMLTPLRLGAWGAGKQLIPESDCVMIVGSNTLASHSTNHGFVAAPTNTIRAEKARGLKIVIIDPRLTETARYADVFLQIYPGEDPTLLAGMIRLILARGWHDREFCAANLEDDALEQLAAAVEPFDLDYVANRCGVAAELIVEATELFAAQSKTGPVLSCTGPSMAPHGNLSDHLIETINVLCGRFRRAGDVYQDISPWQPDYPRHAEVIAPDRSWEANPSRIAGTRLLWGERMSATLADEILTPGEGQVRALFNASGNPAVSMPDTACFARALKELDLLVTVDPYMTATARQSDYVIPPKMMYERFDLPLTFMGMTIHVKPWGQFATPVIAPPEGSELVDDWQVYWGLARRLGKTIELNGTMLDMEEPPTTEGLLAILTKGSAVPLDEIRQHPGGKIFDLPEHRVQPGNPGSNARFDVIPGDIRDELAEIHQQPVEHGAYRSNGGVYTHRLSVRRQRNVMNTVVPQLERTRTRYAVNPAWLHPSDMARLDLFNGDEVDVVSDNGRVAAIVEGDDSVKPGVLSMSHGYGGGGTDADSDAVGSNVNLLISTRRNLDSITAMVRMSAVPVRIEKRS
ncbi:MAG: molybdopterin-dependent oxidoreductase [Blastomonas sp.]